MKERFPITIGPLKRRRARRGLLPYWQLNGLTALCDKGLAAHFVVPRAAKQLWFKVCKTRGQDRVDVVFYRRDHDLVYAMTDFINHQLTPALSVLVSGLMDNGTLSSTQIYHVGVEYSNDAAYEDLGK